MVAIQAQNVVRDRNLCFGFHNNLSSHHHEHERLGPLWSTLPAGSVGRKGAVKHDIIWTMVFGSVDEATSKRYENALPFAP